MVNKKILSSGEAAVFSLRELYRNYGYLPFKMSKFEEYELYIRNKNFLVSDRIITFNDTNGKLLALKPDVTLSIIKNGEDTVGVKQKVCYNENVYRVSERTHSYKEIMQTGLECIGDIDLYDVYECISLAVQSLAVISDEYVLEISHLGILSAILEEVCVNEDFRREALCLIAQKNEHDLRRLCEKSGVELKDTNKLCRIINAYGNREDTIALLNSICTGEKSRSALNELSELSEMLDRDKPSGNIIFDFSVVNDMNYYSGIVFKGFINGISDGVLAGGRYDNLMRRIGRKSGAVGFALYLDMLEQIQQKDNGFDISVLLLYDNTTDKAIVADKVRELAKSAVSVSAQKSIPPKLRYKELIDMRGADKKC